MNCVHHLKYPPKCIVLNVNHNNNTLPGLECREIPIEPVKKTFKIGFPDKNGKLVQRTVTHYQHALTGAYAFTIHCSQGQTIEKAFIDIATPPTGGLGVREIYVALSRCRARQNICLI